MASPRRRGSNWLNVALLGPLAATTGLGSNFLWRWFTDPKLRGRLFADQHGALGREYVADLRAAAARHGPDSAASTLIAELCQQRFRTIWARQEVAVRRTTRKVLSHVQVSWLDLQCDVVLSPASGQRLVLFRAQPGTGTAERSDAGGT